MGDLQKNTHAVPGLSLRVFAGAVLQVFHDL